MFIGRGKKLCYVRQQMWKKEWLCMLIMENLPILVYSFADRQYVSNTLFLSDNKGHICFLQAWILGDMHDAQSSCQMEPHGLFFRCLTL